MLGISGVGSYPYAGVYGAGRVQRDASVQQGESVTRAAALPAAQPETPVQPVSAVPPVEEIELDTGEMLRRWENDPVARATRSRIFYPGEGGTIYAGEQQPAEQSVAYEGLPGAEEANASGTRQLGRSRAGVWSLSPEEAEGVRLPGFAGENDADRLPALEETDDNKNPSFKLPGAPEDPEKPGEEENQTPQEVMEESECQTCKNRKYQDGSDDPGVSFKSPTHIDPEMAASQVRGHEMEHVTREQAAAEREDRHVVSQSVTYHTAICPECGRVYVSGGTTRTSTMANLEESESESGADAGVAAAAEGSAAGDEE